MQQNVLHCMQKNPYETHVAIARMNVFMYMHMYGVKCRRITYTVEPLRRAIEIVSTGRQARVHAACIRMNAHDAQTRTRYR